jgi:RNA polymerase sigma factor (TIGR02999 family)
MTSDRAPQTVTDLLRRSREGSRAALDRLLPIVYDELKSMAHLRLRSERDGHTLDTTALVHETYLKLVRHDRVEWQSRAHFFAVGAQAMRRVLIDYARARNAARRGGKEQHVPVDVVEEEAAELLSDHAADGLVALDDALKDLAKFDERGARVVEFRFFGGLTHDEIAELLGVSPVTARRSWTAAKAWLRKELGPDAALDGGTLGR